MPAKHLKIAFQMEPMKQVNPAKNNTLVMMQSAAARGHTLFQYHPSELSLYDDKVVARAREVRFENSKDSYYELGPDVELNLIDVDVVQVRQDPPFNMEYITATYMLDKVADHTLVVNHPRALRDFPEKIFPLELAEYTPKTLITADKKALASFLDEHKDVIIKPLYLFGGQGVYRAQSMVDLERYADELLSESQVPIVAQPFLPDVVKGDKRVVMIAGQAVGAFLRVPETGSVRANIMQGGHMEACQLTKREQEICAKLGPILMQRGVFVCGFDMIGDYITEINITSPIGFKEIQELDGVDVAAYMWDAIESTLST